MRLSQRSHSVRSALEPAFNTFPPVREAAQATMGRRNLTKTPRKRTESLSDARLAHRGWLGSSPSRKAQKASLSSKASGSMTAYGVIRDANVDYITSCSANLQIAPLVSASIVPVELRRSSRRESLQACVLGRTISVRCWHR